MPRQRPPKSDQLRSRGGAPRGNTNALKHGRRSPRIQRAMLIMSAIQANVPELGKIMEADRRKRELYALTYRILAELLLEAPAVQTTGEILPGLTRKAVSTAKKQHKQTDNRTTSAAAALPLAPDTAPLPGCSALQPTDTLHRKDYPLTDRSTLKIDRKARLQIPRQPFPKQDPEVRIHNWREVYLPIDLETAKTEAMRCIQCPAAPCITACPVGNDIPGAFWKLEQGDAWGAAEVFHQTSNLPEMCGRFCPQERLCEGHCVVGKNAAPVAIGRLEAFVADHYRHHGGYNVSERPAPTGRRVAVVGAGPAGLAVAEELAKRGHAVTTFDAWPEPGGILLYGIPNFKMEKEVLDTKLKLLRDLGVEFVGNTCLGHDITVDQLFERGYQAVFLGHGASVGNPLEAPGAGLPGVLSATEFLVRGNLSPDRLPARLREPLSPGEHVVVVGGGDTAMDCVRTAVRLGASHVTCVYRRTEEEQVVRMEERTHAREEGVRFEYLAAPLRFEAGADGRVARACFERMALGDADAGGRRRPIGTGEEFSIRADTVVIAIGYHADEELAESAGVEHRRDLVSVDRETFGTSRPGVFAAGDCVNGADLVVTAVADARRAAGAIHAYLMALVEEAA